MKRYLNKILTVLGILLAALCLCAAVYAEEDVTENRCGENLTWNLNSGGLLIISGTGPMDDYSGETAPWRWNSTTITAVRIESGVTTVSSNAFSWESGITSVSFPGTLTTIGDEAFAGCDGLTEITIPQSVTRIGDRAFAYCDNLNSVILPDQISWIGNYAFGNNEREFTFAPDAPTAKALGHAGYAFRAAGQPLRLRYLYDGDKCTGLELVEVTKSIKRLSLPDGVTTLYYDALSKCAAKLEYIELPDSVSDLSAYLFRNTSRKFYIKCGSGSYAERFAREYGLQYDNGSKKVIGYNISGAKKKAKWVVSNYITKGMTEQQKVRMIHNWLVNNAHYDLTYSTYSADGVLVKGSGVCNSYALAAEMLLTEAGLANRFLSGSANNGSGYGGHAWNLVRVDGQWYHLDVTWDDPVWSIGKVSKDNSPVISGMERYNYFLITDSQIKKNHRWSGGISADKNKVGSFHHNSQEYAYTAEGAYKLNKSKKTAQFVFPAKAKLKAAKLAIPATVTYSGTAYKITEITKESCRKMSKMKQLTLGDNITKVGSGAFQNCKKLTTVVMGKKMKSIGANAFAGCTKLKTVKYTGTEKTRAKIKISAGNDFLQNGTWKYKKVTKTEQAAEAVTEKEPDPGTEKQPGEKTAEPVPETVKAEVDGLKYKLNPEKKTAAFIGCVNREAKSVTIPSAVKHKGKTYEVTKIAGNACKNMKKLTRVTIGKNVVKIEANAFIGCEKLKTISIKTKKLTGDKVDKKAFKGIGQAAVIQCPSEKLKEYKKILAKKGVPKTAVFR